MTANTPQPTQKPSLPARLLRPKVAVPLTLLLLLILSPFLIRGYHLSRIPDVGEPFDIEARYAVVVPDEENAYVEYREAAALYVAPSPQVEEDREAVIEFGWSHATPELEQHLRDNDPALRVWRRGTEKDRAQYYCAMEIDYDTLDYHTAFFLQREILRNVFAIARRLEWEGKASEEWDWYRASTRTSRHLGQNGDISLRTMGDSMFEARLTRRLEVWAASPSLSSELLKQAAFDTRQDIKLTETISTNLQMEYLWRMEAVEKYLSGGADMLDLESQVSESRAQRFLTAEIERGTSIFAFYLKNQILYCDRTYFQRPARAGTLELFDDPAGLVVNGTPRSIDEFNELFFELNLARLLIQDLQSTMYHADHCGASWMCLPVVLAGQAYHRDHNRFPATLGELVPDYLPEIPIDPFDGLPLKYRVDEEGAVVYSVFTNGVDDGGGEYSIDQTPGSYPIDYGLRLHTPGDRPLVAPKPRDSK